MSRYRQKKTKEFGIDISPLIDMVFIFLFSLWSRRPSSRT